MAVNPDCRGFRQRSKYDPAKDWKTCGAKLVALLPVLLPR